MPRFLNGSRVALGQHTAPVGTEPSCGRRGGVASETRLPCPRDIGTRRRCLPHSTERPKRHGHARHARRSTLCRVVAGYHPLLEPTCPTSARRSSRAPQASLGVPHEWLGHLEFVPNPQEGEIGILVAATGSPAAGFGAWRGVRRSGPSKRGTRHPDIDSGLV